MGSLLQQVALNGILLLILAVPAAAQDKNPEPAPQTVSSSADMSDGEVRKIDRDSGKVTIRHGELKNLDMPPMTMVFQVKNPALLDTLKVGDKIRFRAEKFGSAFVIVDVLTAQ